MMQYVLAQKQGCSSNTSPHSVSPQIIQITPDARLTEVQAEGLYFCLENRLVYICETEIMLTVKEFDIFALLLFSPALDKIFPKAIDRNIRLCYHNGELNTVHIFHADT